MILFVRKLDDGYVIIYIGKKAHPEPEGAVGIAPDHVHLIEKLEEVEQLEYYHRSDYYYQPNDYESMGH